MYINSINPTLQANAVSPTRSETLSLSGYDYRLPGVTFDSNFESGSIGSTRYTGGSVPTYELSLRDDNNNPSLPDRFRTWFYVCANNISTNTPLRLEFVRLGFPDYFVPIYSYDNKNWRHFSESEVQMSQGCSRETLSTCRLTVTKQFTEPTVWIARTFPYTTQDLSKFLDSIRSSPFVKIRTLGKTPYKKWPIQKITITDKRSLPPGGEKASIFINARTHPGETGSSHLLEGLIQRILLEDERGRKLRRDYVFHIVPIQNGDGVILGNYRTNASSQNLENAWRFDPKAPLPSPLTPDVPRENKIVGKVMRRLMLNKNRPVILALNLHSSNSKLDDPPFFYPHFGSDPTKYTGEEQNLWNKQIRFIGQVGSHYSGPIAAPPAEGGKGFLKINFPETWWWHNKKDHVNAITFETVYGRAGLERLVTPADYRKLGEAIAEALADGESQPLLSHSTRSSALASRVHSSGAI